MCQKMMKTRLVAKLNEPRRDLLRISFKRWAFGADYTMVYQEKIKLYAILWKKLPQKYRFLRSRLMTIFSSSDSAKSTTSISKNISSPKLEFCAHLSSNKKSKKKRSEPLKVKRLPVWSKTPSDYYYWPDISSKLFKFNKTLFPKAFFHFQNLGKLLWRNCWILLYSS